MQVKEDGDIEIIEIEDEKSSSDDSVIIIGSSFSQKSQKKNSDPEIMEIAPREYLSAKAKKEREDAVWFIKQSRTNKRRCTQIYKEGIEKKCSVCYTAKHLWIAKCGHVCCQACWKKWLSAHKKCPVCRQRTRVKSLTTFR